MGYVYEGHDPRLKRRVAIKTLTTDAIADADSRERFEREARAAAQLQHPNIVTIYELGNFGGNERPYIVMEYLDGADLTGLIRTEKTIPFAEALDITVQLCKALDFAHQKRVVHRDMKPSNVRWMDDGTVKIMDFGIPFSKKHKPSMLQHSSNRPSSFEASWNSAIASSTSPISL